MSDQTISTSIDDVFSLQIEMIEKVKGRVDPALEDIWRLFSIYLSAYMHDQSLKKSKDFKDVFEHLESNDHIRLGYYDPLINILNTVDVPAARDVKAFQDRMTQIMSKEELDKIEEWKTEKTKVKHVEKSGQDYEAEMVACVQRKLGPASGRAWGTFKLYLELYLPKVDVKSCPDVADAFQKLMNRGEIKFGEYQKFEKIVRKCNVPVAEEILKYQTIMQEILSQTKKEYENKEDASGTKEDKVKSGAKRQKTHK